MVWLKRAPALVALLLVGCGAQSSLRVIGDLPDEGWVAALFESSSGAVLDSTGLLRLSADEELRFEQDIPGEAASVAIVVYSSESLELLRPPPADVLGRSPLVPWAESMGARRLPSPVFTGRGGLREGEARLSQAPEMALTSSWLSECGPLYGRAEEVLLAQNCSSSLCEASIFQQSCTLRIDAKGCGLGELSAVQEDGVFSMQGLGSFRECVVEPDAETVLSAECILGQGTRCRFDLHVGSFESPFTIDRLDYYADLPYISGLHHTGRYFRHLGFAAGELLILTANGAPTAATFFAGDEPRELLFVDPDQLRVVKSRAAPDCTHAAVGLPGTEDLLLIHGPMPFSLTRVDAAGEVLATTSLELPDTATTAWVARALPSPDQSSLVLAVTTFSDPEGHRTRLAKLDASTLELRSWTEAVSSNGQRFDLLPSDRAAILVGREVQHDAVQVFDMGTGRLLETIGVTGPDIALLFNPSGLTYLPDLDLFAVGTRHPNPFVLLLDGGGFVDRGSFPQAVVNPSGVIPWAPLPGHLVVSGLAAGSTGAKGEIVLGLLDASKPRFEPGFATVSIPDEDEIFELVSAPDGTVFGFFWRQPALLRIRGPL